MGGPGGDADALGRADTSPFDQARERFHTLRSHVGVLVNLLAVLSDTEREPLSDFQRGLLERIDAATQALLQETETTSKLVLDALVLAPSSGQLWESACLVEGQLDAAILDQRIAAIQRLQVLPDGGQVIVVAIGQELLALQRFFADRGYFVRLATAPADVLALIMHQPADLLVMVPPVDQMGAWWRRIRILLRDSPRPAFLQIWQAKEKPR